MDENEDIPAGETLFEATASSSDARAGLVLPTRPSCDDRHVIGQIDLPPGPAEEEPREYVPSESVEWVVTVRFPGDPRLEPARVGRLFDGAWRKQFGGFMAYGRDADSGLWTFLQSSDIPRAVTAIQLAFRFEESAGMPASMYQKRLLEMGTRLRTLGAGEPQVTASLAPRDAEARAGELDELKSRLDELAVVMLAAADGGRFEGRAVWDVMLSLGLRWGDMDLFHLGNPTGVGDDYLFSVQTSTPPGYFFPEHLASGRMAPQDLDFSFSIPRSPAPEAVLEGMLRAVEYCRGRLGGTVLNSDGELLEAEVLRAHVAEIAEELRRVGLPPGAHPTMVFF